VILYIKGDSMDNKTYQKSALRTNGPDRKGVFARVNGHHPKEIVTFNENPSRDKMQDLLHASMGLVTESGEFQDALKKHIFYGRELDTTNLKEEIGDLLWYCAIALEALGTDFEAVMQTNIDKLKARYPEKFTEEKAENRNLVRERKILENGQ
jgi:NTP pyrophosphatase (non-canonical NTP hydrolase)